MWNVLLHSQAKTLPNLQPEVETLLAELFFLNISSIRFEMLTVFGLGCSCMPRNLTTVGVKSPEKTEFAYEAKSCLCEAEQCL